MAYMQVVEAICNLFETIPRLMTRQSVDEIHFMCRTSGEVKTNVVAWFRFVFLRALLTESALSCSPFSLIHFLYNYDVTAIQFSPGFANFIYFRKNGDYDIPVASHLLD